MLSICMYEMLIYGSFLHLVRYIHLRNKQTPFLHFVRYIHLHNLFLHFVRYIHLRNPFLHFVRYIYLRNQFLHFVRYIHLRNTQDPIPAALSQSAPRLVPALYGVYIRFWPTLHIST